MNPETKIIPLKQISYEELQKKAIEQQTELFVKDQEIEKLKNRIHALEKHNRKLDAEAQKYFELLIECSEYLERGDQE